MIIGAIAPFKILKFLLGIIFDNDTSLYLPKPLHELHAPFGELNENFSEDI